MKKLNLNSSTVLNKKFSIELSGYNAKEVDMFLDKILEDFTFYEQQMISLQKTIDEKNKLINDKEEEIEKLNLDLTTLKEQLDKTGRATNVELLNEIRKIQDKMGNK